MQKLEYAILQLCLWFFMGMKLGLLILGETHRGRVFENGAEEDILTKENCILKSFIILFFYQSQLQWMILRWILERFDGVMWTGLVWFKIW
jgi:hypothetical protein